MSVVPGSAALAAAADSTPNAGATLPNPPNDGVKLAAICEKERGERGYEREQGGYLLRIECQLVDSL